MPFAKVIGPPETILVKIQPFSTVYNSPDAVLTIPQNLTEAQKAQARENIGVPIWTTDETLSMSETNVLSVNTATNVEEDNTLPITAAAVYSTVGNIEILLETI